MRSTTIFEIEGLLLNGGHARSNEGDDYNFSPELVKKIYDNMTTGIHCEITHGGNRVGYVHKWWLANGGSDIGYNALIYEPSGIVAIRDEGFSAGSPDLELFRDDSGNIVDGHLKALAFVKDPAMDNTGLQIIRAAFSRQQGDSSMVDKKEGDEQNNDSQDEEQGDEEEMDEQDQQDTSDESSDDSSSDSDDSSEPTLKDVMALLKSEQEERKKLQSKLDTVVSANKKLANSQLESLKADIKAHGINPDDMIKGLSDKQAMQVLQTLKASMAGRRSISATPGKTGKPGGSGKSKPDEVFEGALKFLGMDMETYLELSGKKKVE